MGKVGIYLDAAEDVRLLKMAMSRENSSCMDFEKIVAEQGYL